VVALPYTYRNARLKPRQWIETYYYALGNVWKGDDPTLFKYQIHGRMAAGVGVWAKGIVVGEVNVRDSFPKATEWTIRGFYTTSYYKIDPAWAVVYLDMWNLVRVFADGRKIAEVNVDGGWDYKEFTHIFETPYTTTNPTVTIEREVGMVGSAILPAYAGCGTGASIGGGANIGVLLIADVTVSEIEAATLIVVCVDKNTKKAIEGIEVSIAGPETRTGKTDASGSVRFDNVITGTYTVTLKDPQNRYYGQTVEAVSVTPPTTTQTFELEPMPSPFAPVIEALQKYWWVAAIPVGVYVVYKLIPKAKPAYERALEKLAEIEVLKRAK
jgi:hypothetical protein